MNDIPYIQSKHLTPETTAIMARVCSEIKQLLPPNIPTGVQVIHGSLHGTYDTKYNLGVSLWKHGSPRNCKSMQFKFCSN